MTDHSDTGEGPYTGNYLDYLLTNRNFTAPAVAGAVSVLTAPVIARSVSTGQPVRILDAGTGAGGALPELSGLAAEVPEGGTVLAVDVDGSAVALARQQIAALHDTGASAGVRVDLRVADLRGVAAEAALTGQFFDLIWSSDVIWPEAFDDPEGVVSELSRALAPGGILALFTTNYYQSTLLPGHTRLERLIRTASEMTWGLPDDGPYQYERLGAWMRQAGLHDVTPTSFPLTGMASEPTARAFLEQIVWPEMRHAVSANGRAAGMSDDDVVRAEHLLDPAGQEWIGNDPDAFVLQPTLLWTGRAG
ncbi:class I SAM-dependent methyltransferase [Corynebacterium sp.]|uniref:class I SAM-dependent methyltransferase n=1 Tax=Corynebacterium sp. TaxID=1720 RepID=UPI0028A7E5C5|nr:class I SAM-dependent methyltransferase [Corynebacterium sp.]